MYACDGVSRAVRLRWTYGAHEDGRGDLDVLRETLSDRFGEGRVDVGRELRRRAPDAVEVLGLARPEQFVN